MFGPKIRNVFKSRWHAVAWSLSVLLTAYCSVPHGEQADRSPDTHKVAAHHVNPWANDSPADRP